MCHPSGDTILRSHKESQNAIKSVFGDGKIDDETSKFYSEHRFYLPNSPENFELQLHTCVDALEAFTCEGGIASEGYVQMANLIEENYSDYRSAFRADPFLGIRIGYFLDRVFQRFLDKLVHYVHKKKPLRSASKELKGFQKEEVNRVFSNMGSGVFPNIPLPMSLSAGAPPPLPPISRPSGSPPKFGGETKTTSDGINRGAVPAWAIPSGKSFSDFFDSKRQPDNFKGFPEVDHHKKKGKAMICLKFQVLGKCTSKHACNFAHVEPQEMHRSTYDALSKKFQEIYKK
jgi:hypothetical protein